MLGYLSSQPTTELRRNFSISLKVWGRALLINLFKWSIICRKNVKILPLVVEMKALSGAVDLPTLITKIKLLFSFSLHFCLVLSLRMSQKRSLGWMSQQWVSDAGQWYRRAPLRLTAYIAYGASLYNGMLCPTHELRLGPFVSCFSPQQKQFGFRFYKLIGNNRLIYNILYEQSLFHGNMSLYWFGTLSPDTWYGNPAAITLELPLGLLTIPVVFANIFQVQLGLRPWQNILYQDTLLVKIWKLFIRELARKLHVRKRLFKWITNAHNLGNDGINVLPSYPVSRSPMLYLLTTAPDLSLNPNLCKSSAHCIVQHHRNCWAWCSQISVALAVTLPPTHVIPSLDRSPHWRLAHIRPPDWQISSSCSVNVSPIDLPEAASISVF